MSNLWVDVGLLSLKRSVKLVSSLGLSFVGGVEWVLFCLRK